MSSLGSDIRAGYSSDALPRLEQAAKPQLAPVSTRVVRDLVRAADALLVVGAGALALLIAAAPSVAPGAYMLAAGLAGLAVVVVYTRADLYSLAVLLDPARRTPSAIAGLAVGVAVALGALLLVGLPAAAALGWTPVFAVLAGGGLAIGRWVTLTRMRRWQAQGRLSRKMAIVGVNELSAALIGRIDMAAPNTCVVGLYVERDEPSPGAQLGVPVLGGLDDLIVQSRAQAIDTIVVALPLVERQRVEQICDRLREVACDVYLTADVIGLRYRAAALAEIDGHPVIVVRRRPLKDWQGVQKRTFDLVLGWIIMLLLLPLMTLVALAIRLDSPGPILFRQRRLGFNNNVITVLKFRTMHHHMSDPLANRLTERGDKRITRVGGVLRRYSLDELPQIFNVLAGNMSLVGPRPHPLNAKAANRLYGEVVAEYARRHVVKPGITGWAQVSGWRGETSTEEQIRQRVAHDLHYIENWSLRFDIRIIWFTLIREVVSSHAF